MVGRCRIGRWACLAGSAEVSSPVTRRGDCIEGCWMGVPCSMPG